MLSKAIVTRTIAIIIAVIVIAAVAGAAIYMFTRPPMEKPVIRILFASTQLAPPAEQAFMVELLTEFYKETGIDVSFLPFGYVDIANKLEAEIKAGRITVSLVGGLSTEIDFFASKGLLEDLGRFGALGGRTFLEAAIRAVEDHKKIYGITTFVPWMTATFVVVINNKAFDYLPSGLTKDDVVKGTERWTWDAMLAWAKNIYEKTGKRLVGLPAGAGGLLHRLLHGYLYVSYTGYQAQKFNSPEAVQM
jgi:multiple sugar transport system substrate-binding protein